MKYILRDRKIFGVTVRYSCHIKIYYVTEGYSIYTIKNTLAYWAHL